MYSGFILVNCPYCDAGIEVSRLELSAKCPFCEKRFSVKDGQVTEQMIHDHSAANKGTAIESDGHKPINMQASTRVKYCTECGRKLAYDARFCDWCGVRIS